MKASERSPTPPAAVSRRSVDLNTPQALAWARVFVPLLFGLYSVWLGADSNWDLTNYHLYNPFAWRHGRLLTDIAPAGMQSYFNPLLDVPFYWMNTHLPPRLAGFLMGALHGVSFILLLEVAQRALPELSTKDRYRVPLFLALACCLSASFLSGLGNSMGDDTTALFSLAGLLVLLVHWNRLPSGNACAVLITIGSGALVGLGVGLKLTNACYAVAMCVALLSYPERMLVRVRLAFLFGVGVLLGWGITGGYWMFHMWQTFGNPLYPQFSKFFPNPLTVSTGTADTRWLPHGIVENVLWPLIFTANPHRVGEAPVRQIIWPIVYVLFGFWIVATIAGRVMRRDGAQLNARARFLLLYVAIGYLMWMKLFSIYRYVVAVEMLTPIAAFLLLHRVCPLQHRNRVAAWLIGGATIITVAGGAKTWGHEGWTDPLYHAEIPPITAPASTSAVIYPRVNGWAWLATLFPHEVAFTQIHSSFPASPAFNDRIRELVVSRGGQGFALIDGYNNWRAESVARVQKVVERLGLTQSARGCDVLNWAATRFRLHVSVEAPPGDTAECRLGVRADDLGPLPTERNHALAEEALPAFADAGLTLEPESCVPYNAWIGDGLRVYQWCRVRPR